MKDRLCPSEMVNSTPHPDALNHSPGVVCLTGDADGLCPLLARTPGADSEERFVRGHAPIPGAGDLAARERTEGQAVTALYDITDHLGNAWLTVDASAETVASRALNAWGAPLALSGGAEARRY